MAARGFRGGWFRHDVGLSSAGHGPQIFEVVERACRGQHDVHHDVSAVDQHPFACGFAFDGDHLPAGFSHLVAHVVRHGFGLTRAVGSGYDDRIVDGRLGACVEDSDVASLDVFKGGDGGFLNGIKLQLDSACKGDAHEYRPALGLGATLTALDRPRLQR